MTKADLTLGPDFGDQLASVYFDKQGLSDLIANTFANPIHPAGQQPGGYHLASQLAERVIVSAQADPGAVDNLVKWVVSGTYNGPEDVKFDWDHHSFVGPEWQGSNPSSSSGSCLRSTDGGQAYILEHILARYKALWDDLDHVTSEPSDWDSTSGPSRRKAQVRMIFGPTLVLGELFNFGPFRAQLWGIVEDVLRRVALTSGTHSCAGYVALAILIQVSGPALDEWTSPAPDGEGICGWGTQWLEIYGVVQHPFERWTFASACKFVGSYDWAPSRRYLEHMPTPVRRLFDDILALARSPSWHQSSPHVIQHPSCAVLTEKYEWLLED